MASPLKPEAFDRIERADLSRSLPAESTVRSAGSDSSSAHPASSHHRGIAASASSLSLSSEEPGEMELLEELASHTLTLRPTFLS